MNPLTITERHTAAGPVVAVSGDLDYAHAATLRERVERLALRPGQCLVLDLAGLEFCDSSGITALLAARQHALAARADIALASVPANTLRILTMVGLDQVFALRSDAASA
ncbi:MULTISPECIES: STAS domain-containing protein [Streptomyces]|uniref:Anti-sigma factor antagonist n=1 Tax=Streptomyces sudanensis TaxID=436397 RepID=A0ABY4T8X0_9ACTN|nr:MULTISPECIES: STAS domain-containing protein [Streptomyces]MCP9956234.1 STAS domain-containing protein [Streptomyces sudanensis]MCP9985445.1 STAS domain-containing protein [Streptomyces sudanensis]MCQ0003134.1 STAS domain-containing protein [Streptomyces sudanensis]URN14668.1 STAS domain-containing protein [Streptomyces sudanensis]